MGTLVQDLKYGARMLLKNPGYTVVAVLTLALGLGANTVMFSYVNQWVIHPLPYPESERLISVLTQNTETGNTSIVEDPGDFYDFQNETRTIEQMCAWSPASFNLTGDGPPERIQGARVSWNFFKTLEARPALGRPFLPEEDQPGAHRVAILSRGLWETRYAGDPRIIGRTIQIGGESYEVVGVMPGKFQMALTGDSNLWVPLALTPEERANRENNWIWVLGRLKPGATMAAAQAELSGIAARLEKEYPKTNTHAGVVLDALESEIGKEQGNQEVLALFGIVSLVLLIGCANVANLALARATGRRRELAVRAAIGAGRARLVRQFLTEMVLLFLAGSVAALGVAYGGLGWLQTLIPARIRGFLVNYGEVNLDSVTMLYTFAIAFVTGIAFGVAPAFSATKMDVNSSLKAASGRATDAKQGSRLRSALVVGEIALAVVAVICSALVVKGFLKLTRENPGFRPAHVVVAELELPAAKYKDLPEIRNFYSRVMERIKAMPEAAAAGAASAVPFGDCCQTVGVYAAGKPAPRPGEIPWTHYFAVMPGYFAALGIDLVKGRGIEDSDGASAAPVVVINEAFADYFWPGADPIGQQVRFEGEQTGTAIVVGVVRNVKLFNSPKLEHRRDRELYVPFAQFPSRTMGIVVRSSGDAAAVAAAIRDAIWAEDRAQPLSQIRPLEAMVSEQYAGFDITSELMGLFIALAVFLGAIGVYGVMAYSVSQSTHEIGIRMALGAQRGTVLRMVLAGGAKLAGLGVAIGLAVAFGAAQLIRSILYGVSPGDPWIYAGATLLLCVVALAACYVPARRAMKVDPMVALRYE
jgi:putative ABC transport system permease protein